MLISESQTRNHLYIEDKEKRQKTPFLIRPHHLYQFALLMEYTADELARDITEIHKGEINKNEKSKAHAIDIFGPGFDFDGQKKKLKDIFKKFLSLEDDNPVHIGCGLDEICKTCFAGKHCRMKNIESFGGAKDVVKNEEEYLTFFLRRIKEGDKLKIVEEQTVFKESTEKTRLIITDARTVKNILFGTNYTGTVTL